jgi:nitrite reductase (NADH) large subunit
MRKLLIIGCGMATARLLQELVARGHDYAIEVIGEEASPGYNRVLLSSLLAGDKQESDLALHAADWYRQHGIALHTGEQVVALDTTRRLAVTSRNRVTPYDLLVFATGSVPAWPQLPGIATGNVLAFRNQRDLQDIRSAAGNCSRAVVLGAGLLGLEAASGLQRLGLRVTVLHRQASILNRQLDDSAATILQNELEKQDINFLLGRQPQTVISCADKVSALALDDGSTLPCDLLLVATGVTPNIKLAESAGIPCDKGILVDRQMRSQIDAVYALGECCQHEDRIYGLVAPVHEQAEVLAALLCRDLSATYHYQDAPVHLKIAGIQVVSAGQQPFPADSQSQVLCDPVRGIYRRLVFSKGRLCGFVLVGDKLNSAWYQSLLEQGSEVGACRPWMMFSAAPKAQPSLSAKESLHASH